MKRPTIHDVAAGAGVSKSTVSLVLQGSPAVKADTRDTVRRVMAELGYVYNRSAAGLRSAKVGLIGLVINDLRNPFFTEFATSVQMELSARGYATVIGNTDEDPVLQAQVVGSMIEHGVSALIISPCYGDPDAFALAQVPTLQVLRRVHPDTARFPLAAPDFARGSEIAAQHLVDRGAQHVAFVGGLAGRSVTLERMQGYLAVMQAQHRVPFTLPGRASREFGREAALLLARDHRQIDAVLCFNDLTALGLLSGCAELGRQVGPGFRVVGCDDIAECQQSHPKLTSLRCDIAGFGRQTAATLLDWLETGTHPAPETRTPVTLVNRASSP
ncbi:MAG: LacI family DNA-binding transcriptional regulator [Pseudorhodobacter sp.]|nr:LacI family DNA-binding transcriptional regulator [Pseudorhodobacter sp.]